MLIIDNFTTVMPYIRCKFNKIVTDIPGQCEMKNIRYLGNQEIHFKRGRNGAKMLIIDNFTTVMPYIRCKLNNNRYISSLQIYLDSVK